MSLVNRFSLFRTGRADNHRIPSLKPLIQSQEYPHGVYVNKVKLGMTLLRTHRISSVYYYILPVVNTSIRDTGIADPFEAVITRELFASLS